MTIFLHKYNDEPFCWILTVGNPTRGDDGAGPFVAGILQAKLPKLPGLNICSFHQLDICLLDDVKRAQLLIFVDACTTFLKTGVKWTRIAAEKQTANFSPHCLTPGMFMALFERLYQHRPAAWEISIQGHDFSFKEDLSLKTRRYAYKAVNQIILWLSASGFGFTAILI